MSRRPSKPRRSKRSKAKSGTRPRNRRLDVGETEVAEKVASKPSRRKAKGTKQSGSKAADRREERRLSREARAAERAALRAERKARWSARIEWTRDPRTKQIFGVLALSTGAFMFLAGVSAILVGGEDIRMIASGAEPGGGSYRNLLGALGAKWAFSFMRGGFGISAPLFGVWLLALGARQFSEAPTWAVGRFFRNILAASLVLPWAIGLLTLQFDGETGLVTGWGGDHLVGAVGLWLTQWSRFTLGVAGSVMALVAVIAIWSLLNPRVSAFLASFFAREVLDEDKSEIEQEVDAPRSARELADAEEASWDPYAEPDRIPEAGTESSPPIATNTAFEDQGHADGRGQDELLPPQITPPEPEVEPAATAVDSTEVEAKVPPADEPVNGPVSNTTMEVQVAAEEATLTEDEIDAKVQAFGEYDPTLDLSRFELPNIDLLAAHGSGKTEVSPDELEANKNRIEDTLQNYGIEIASIKASIGPTVTLYELVPAPGVRISKIKNLEDDIALSLAALGIRIIAPIPGRGTIGIEVPNSNPDVVSMRSLIASDKFQNSDAALPIAIGKTISNETYVFDLAKMPHMLMAGATGQGKSVGLNAMLVSLLYKKHPSQLKFVLVDPKKVELTLFNHIERHYLAKLPAAEEAIITDNSQVVRTIKSLCLEMDQRYELLKNAQCRNLKEYNAKFVRRKLNPENGHRYLPYIVLVIDEFADLIMTAGKEVEMPIARLAQLARAIGIHLIIATQRPSVNIITGTIKANFPGRVAFRVTSKVDSRTILDAGGADQLIGRGDMLLSTGNDLIRLQCGFVDTPEVEAITDFIGSQRGYPDALLLPEVPDEHSEQMADIAGEDRDVMFEEAARILVLHQQGSTSLLQRKLKLGYNRAGRLVDQLEAAGVIGPFEGSKARKVLIPDEASLEQLLRGSGSDDTTND